MSQLHWGAMCTLFYISLLEHLTLLNGLSPIHGLERIFCAPQRCCISHICCSFGVQSLERTDLYPTACRRFIVCDANFSILLTNVTSWLSGLSTGALDSASAVTCSFPGTCTTVGVKCIIRILNRKILGGICNRSFEDSKGTSGLWSVCSSKSSPVTKSTFHKPMWQPASPYIYIYTVDSAFSGHCVKRTTVLSGQIVWSRLDLYIFQCKILCVKRTSVLCGQ